MTLFLIVSLVVIGCLLLFVEIFIPGGVVGALGGIALIAAVVLGFKEGTSTGLATLLGAALGGGGSLVAGLWMLPRTPFARKLFNKKETTIPAVKQ